MDIDIEKLAKTVAESINLKDFKGDIVGVKVVENEIGNVEPGGIGVQINHGVQEKNAEPADEEQQDEHEEADAPTEEPEKPKEKLNFFAPTNSLQLLLKQAWFAEVRSDAKYDAAWTDAFVEALMASEYGEDIARQWQEKEDAKRSKQPQIKARLIGTLKDSGVLLGSYGQIAEAVGIVVNDNGGKKKKPYKSFADYMGRYKGRKPDYADWVREYVQSH